MKDRIVSAVLAMGMLIAAVQSAVIAEDTSAPCIHYRPAKGAFADAIPFYWQGTYHVFYLRAGLGGTTWEHISSPDLLRWQEHPTALPLGKPEEPDGECVFTGSILHHDGLFHAFYTGWNPSRSAYREQIMHATSADLIQWTKHAEHTFHADGKIYQDQGGKDFRDPFVLWEENTKRFVMHLFVRRTSDGRAVVGRYTSDDLAHWTPAQPLDYGKAGECPDVFSIADRWYLLLSFGGMAWASADRLDGRFQSPKDAHLDTPMLYAVKRMEDGRRHIAVGFIRDLQDRRDYGRPNWGGTMCLPRELYRGAAGQLCVRPAEEITDLFSEKVLSLADKPVYSVRAGDWQYHEGELAGKGDQVAVAFPVPHDYMLLLEAKPTPIGKVTIRFRDQGPHGGGYSLAMDLKHQTTELRAPLYTYERATALPWDRPIRVQAFLQGDILECFVNEEHAFTCRAYDLTEGQLSIHADDGGVSLEKVEIRRIPQGR
jgi:beta-fructofuranosidase